MEFPLEVDVATAAQQVRAGALLLDVREPFETAICSVAGSRPIPMRQVPENLADLPRDQPILVLCHHGQRSLRVTQFLRANGFAQVSNVAGGIAAWSEQMRPLAGPLLRRLTPAARLRHNCPFILQFHGSTTQQTHQKETPRRLSQAPQCPPQGRPQGQEVTCLPGSPSVAAVYDRRFCFGLSR
ncbi:MAG: rhodanese-like domain-containing protein [Lacunisphaera sp.]